MSESASVPVLSQPAEHVALIELNRPANANRLEPQDLDALQRHLDECESSQDIRVLILTGRGKYFSAGFDLRALTDDLKSGARSNAGDNAFEAVANRFENTRLIAIAAINGPVLGGATDLALACDFRIGSLDGFMQMPAARFGLPLYAGALQRYVSRMGLNAAKALVLMAERMSAEEMLQAGFLTELAAAGDVLMTAMTKASHLRAMPTKNMGALKAVLNASALGNGTTQRQRDILTAAFQPQLILQNIAASQAARHNG
ncbi:enoyl-CoA hydratase/isomerase family protein [Bradyrhizobium sp. LTSP849]|uniref:enoyl-CoA hydratase/isomerase family protein n=1 Tax=Bradyrhizobium sp. LTSP849 TaxID=1615890 RepID=UPI0005D13898|nr:enoyl-CoA hydratase/isomerase family protein [Bradyrhizobium sp. LTSP849]